MIFGKVDWDLFFVPAVWSLLSGTPIYGGHGLYTGFYNPPYVLGLLIPFALLPAFWSRVAMLIVIFATLAFVGKRLGASPLALGMFLLSPVTLQVLFMCGVEWTSLIGLVLANSLGVMLMLIKPQMTIGTIVFLLVEKVRARDWKNAVVLIAPSVALYALSAFVFPDWLPSVSGYGDAAITNAALPVLISLPIGTILMVVSLATRRKEFAIASSPFFFSTISPNVWIVIPLAFISSTRLSLLIFVAFWAIKVWIG